jgi:hypothetical protein
MESNIDTTHNVNVGLDTTMNNPDVDVTLSSGSRYEWD